MLKDPHHTEMTAYELLNLPFDAPLNLVQSALVRFMQQEGKKKPHLLGPAQQAAKKLQSPKGRAEIDIWLYDIKLTSENTSPAEALDLDEFSRPRVLPVSELYCDLTGADLEKEKRSVTLQKVKFSDIRFFDDVESWRFSPWFDH